MIFETHAHYDHRQYNEDRDKILSSLPAKNISKVINIGCDMPSSRMGVKMTQQYTFMYATVGVHPHDAKTLTESCMDELATLAKNEKIVAFGEIGLDFNKNFSPHDAQRKWFKRQLEVAADVDLPVVIHSRDADEEVFAMIVDSPHRRGVVHAFPGDVALAQRYVDLGFYLGIGGILTYDKTGRLKSVVEAMPLDKLLLETDCPFLTPAPHRGKRNESGYLPYIIDAIAGIKKINPAEIEGQTYTNACALFGIK